MLRVTTRLPVVWATAVLSNVGNALPADDGAAGGLCIVAHDALPPLRPRTNLALFVAGHHGRLGLTIRYAPESLSGGQARRLLERVLAEAASLLDAERASA